VRFQGRRYAFVFANRAVSTGYEDPILDLVAHRVSDEIAIFGLTSLGMERDYLVPAPDYGPWLDELEDGDTGEGFFLECKWRLEYL